MILEIDVYIFLKIESLKKSIGETGGWFLYFKSFRKDRMIETGLNKKLTPKKILQSILFKYLEKYSKTG